MRPLNALAVIFVTTLAVSGQGVGGLEVAYVATGSLEGPTADADGNVYFSDRGAGGIQKLETQGRVTAFRQVRTNGLVFDPQFRLVVVETGQTSGAPSRVTRIDTKTGKTEVLADSYQGTPFRGTNDVTCDGKGRIWFTNDLGADPGGVYRIDLDGKLTRVLSVPADVQYPNGLIVSPDDRRLYVIETSGEVNGHRRITAFDLSADGRASNGRMFHDFYPGRSGDGMSIDSAGNLWVAAGLNKLRASQNGAPSTETLDTKAGVYEFAPDGKQLNFYPVSEDLITNTAFGGPDLRTLYVTAGSTLFKMRVTTPGTRR
jgi:gluconolactonase